MPSTPKPFRVYVIQLRSKVLHVHKFKRANPDHAQGKPCLYVGSTRLTPEQRYQRHIDPRSKVACRLVRRLHLRLDIDLTSRELPHATRKAAELRERALAKELRRKGYAVWQK